MAGAKKSYQNFPSIALPFGSIYEPYALSDQYADSFWPTQSISSSIPKFAHPQFLKPGCHLSLPQS